LKDLNASIAHRFGIIAGQHGRRAAVQTPDQTLTYAGLNRRANELAALILGAAPNSSVPVGVALPLGVELIVAIVACLQAGRPYVYLDPAHPPVRLQTIVEHSGVDTMLAGAQPAESLEQIRERAVFINVEAAAGQDPAMSARDLPHVPPDAPCCIFYTSGSQGEPKGVVVSHRCLLHNARNYTHSLGVGPADRLAQLGSPGFAASASVIFGALLNGACLFPFDVRRHGIRSLTQMLQEESITILHLVPTLFRALSNSLEPGRNLPELRLIKLGGEPAHSADIELLRTRFHDGVVLINGLGLTEAGGNVAHFRVEPGTRIDSPVVPVGYPLENQQIDLVDAAGQAVPAGAMGEITVASPFLASGYWRNPELTRERFEPSDDGRGTVRYRTGDLGRWTADGCLEHLGRLDQQVKVRGYRIEMPAVEAALLKLGSVEQAAVVCVADRTGEQRLVAFVAARPGREVGVPDLRRKLEAVLPGYMVPAQFVVLPAMPLTLNGKIDRRALAPPEPTGDSGGTETGATENSLESLLKSIWEKALGMKVPSLRDSFFELGGDSLSAVQILDAVYSDFGANLPPGILVEAPTIEALAARLRSDDGIRCWLPVLPIQRRGTQAPLFCFPQGGGDGLIYHDLSRRLGEDQPLFCLRPGLPSATGESPLTLEDAVAPLIPEILSIQPRGPLHLCGVSYGGMAAWETARQLRAADRTVGLIILVDTYGPGLAGYRLRELQGFFPRIYILLQKLKLHGELLACSPRERGMRHLRSRTAARLRTMFPQTQGGAGPVEFRNRLFANHLATFRRYQPRPCDDRVALVRGRIQFSRKAYRDRTLGWAGMVSQPLDIREVPGFHTLLLCEPFAGMTAKAVQECLSYGRGNGPISS
jgi:amino acid adenylation domain-containing protein